MNIRVLLYSGLILVSNLFTPQNGYAWGDLGHQVICGIALQELTPSARAEVIRLVKLDPEAKFRRFPTACTWPDNPRQRATEHFMNLPRTQTAVTSADQNCGAAEVCVLTAIEADTQVLRDTTASDTAKLAALKFLGHWIGDLHQPLHISFLDDRGGNEILTFGTCDIDLHAVWDTCLIERGIGRSANKIVTVLREQLTNTNRQEWTQGDTVTWANESYQVTLDPAVKYCVQVGATCRYAVHNVTWKLGEPRRGVTVKATYIATHTATVRDRLLKAGVRLGHILNGIFDPS